ncbi:MAG: ABC transporter substrate-binding protein [Alphaproteobacteria bacterium]
MRKVFRGAVAAGAMLLATPLAAENVKLTTQGITDTEILIGTHADLSGPLSSPSSEGRDGMLLRIDEINAAGGINGRKLRLIVEDTGYDTKRAVLATQKLVDRDKVFALVFPFGTNPTLASLQITREKGIPLMFAGTGATALHTPPSKLSFGYFLPDEFFMRLGVDYAIRELKPKRVGAIYQGDDYGEAMMAGAKAALAKHKMQLVESVSYKPGATDFSAQVARLKAANVDLVLLGTALRETVGVARERQKLGWDAKMLGGFPVYTSLSLALGKEAMEGVYAVGQNKIFYADTATPQVKDWYARFRAKFNREGGPTGAAGYNSVAIFAEAAKAAGRNLTADSLIEGMYKVKYTDIFDTPETTFTPQRHMPPLRAFVAQVRNNRWEILTPFLSE